MTFTLSSKAFKNNCSIPEEYTADGLDLSPPLEWSFIPRGSRAFAIICDDTDAPTGIFVHWVIYDLPGDFRSLRVNIPRTASLDNGARQGLNDFGDIGYRGPSPASGITHRYFFKLYALECPTGLEPGASKDQLLDAMAPIVLGQARLMGTYRR